MKKKRKPHAWAIQMASLIEGKVAGGEPLPFALENVELGNGESIRFLQEVGFAKSWLDKEQERENPLSWSVKRVFLREGAYTFTVGPQVSLGRTRSSGMMESLLGEAIKGLEREQGIVPMEEFMKGHGENAVTSSHAARPDEGPTAMDKMLEDLYGGDHRE